MTIGTWIFFGFMAFVVLVLWTGTGHKRRARRLQRRFASMAAKLGMQISSHDQFGSRAMGIDHRTNKLLFMQRVGFRLKCLTIDLNGIANCTYRKLYLKTPYRTANNQVKLMLNEILLEFDRNDHVTITLPLFQSVVDGFPHTEQLEVRARYWEQLVQRRLPQQPATHPLRNE